MFLTTLSRNLMEGMSQIGDTSMFVESSYIHSQNSKEYPMFIMNRDGFTLLTMGFTGQKALQFKLDYISAFNKMEVIKFQQNIIRSLSQVAGCKTNTPSW